MATIKSTTYFANLTSITTKKHRVDGEAEISTQVDKNGFTYTHIATNDDTTITTITARNVPVGKIMFFKYRLSNGYYPAGHFGVSVFYNRTDSDDGKCAVGTRTGGVLNIELAKRHRGWVVGRVNAQTALKSAGLWTSDDKTVQADSITIEIAHKDDLDIAYFMTDHYDANLMPIVKEYGDDYYMHQNIEFGCYIEDQWRKINDTMNGGAKQYDPFTPPGLPEHPEEGDPVYYTLSFNLNGRGSGTDLSNRTIKKGKKANKPNDPTATESYAFGGWYTDAQCTSEYDFNTPVTCDLVLYAKWIQITIAYRLTQVAETMPKVYNAGYEKGKSEGNSYYDFFWDSIQAYGNRERYEYAFDHTQWDKPCIPKYPFKGLATNSFGYTKISDNLYTDKLDVSQCSSLNCAFTGSDVTRLKRIDARATISGRDGMGYIFRWCGQLKEITEFYPSVNANFSGTFSDCKELETINFCSEIAVGGLDLKASTKLSRASIESVIIALSDNTSGLTVTLSRAAVNKAFETIEGANDGESSGAWCDDLVDTKPNWTISLV